MRNEDLQHFQMKPTVNSKDWPQKQKGKFVTNSSYN